MEIPSSKSPNKQDNRKMSIKMVGGGGNIGGFILLGGALAAATFLGSAFAKSKKRRSNNHRPVQPPQPELDLEKTYENHTRNGLTLVLPDSSENESSDVESGSPLPTVLEEKPNLQANGVLTELEYGPSVDESEISSEEYSVLNNITPDFTEDVKDNNSSDGIEEILESGEAIEAEDSFGQIPVEDIREDLETLKKGYKSDSEIAEEETEEIFKETDLHKVEEECTSDSNIIIKSDQEDLEGTGLEVEMQLIEDEETICSIEASEVTPMQELIQDEQVIWSVEASEVMPMLELMEDEEVICESEVMPAQEFSLQDSVSENVNNEEEEYQHIQTDEEQDLTKTDDQEAEQKDCSIEVFDHSPEVFEPEDRKSNKEDGDLISTEYSIEAESKECVVAETSNSDEGCEEEIQLSEEQEKLVFEIIEKVVSTEEYSAELVAEDYRLIRSDDAEEENVGTDAAYVNGKEQLQLSEHEDSKDEESDADCEDEDTSEEAEESSEGTEDSSMESNADAVWPVEKSTHEELPKYLLDDSKMINNNPTDKKNYSSKVNLLTLRVWILLFLAPLLLLLLLVHIFKPSFYYAPL